MKYYVAVITHCNAAPEHNSFDGTDRMRRIIATLICAAVSVPCQLALGESPFFHQGGPPLTPSSLGAFVAISADGHTAIMGNSSFGDAWVFVGGGGVDWRQQSVGLRNLISACGPDTGESLGNSAALSAKGDTAIVAGGNGASVFRRDFDHWTCQAKLPGFPQSVAVSADGDTAAFSAEFKSPHELFPHSAVWVFTRSAGVWTQRGMLIGDSTTQQTSSVALSADGNTVILGEGWGRALVFTLALGVWTKQGVLEEEHAAAPDGEVVALSADGNTAMLGPNHHLRGVAIFIRTAGVWTEQGELYATEEEGADGPGSAVALSADGNIAVFGWPNDNQPIFQPGQVQFGDGAVWVFTRSGGVWTQQGDKLTPEVKKCSFGRAVALSGDGNTAIFGGDCNLVWIFIR